MPRLALTRIALVLAIFALSSTQAAACGWSRCGYAAPSYSYDAPPVYYVPRAYYPPYVYHAHPSYAYDPRSVGYIYGQRYAPAYYVGRGVYTRAGYYRSRRGYVGWQRY